MTSIGHHGRRGALVAAAARSTSRRIATTGDAVVRQLVLAAAVVVAVVVLAPVSDVSAEPASGARASLAPTASLATLVERLDELDATVHSSRAALVAADGHVLEETTRTALASELERADAALLESRAVLVWPPGSQPSGALDEVAVAVSGQVQALGERVAAVTDAVAAWEAEQARIAAEQEAARAAAAAARTRVAAGGGRAPVSGVAHVEGIWTSGGQAEIDACRGSVNVPGIAGYLGASFYAAEHWSCGGSAWGRIGAGAMVQFPGYGTYRVAGVVSGLAYGSDASVVPGGYAGYYQTCIGGSGSNMAVWLLERVG
ncbi:MAG: hypothetical protein QM598_00305 [Protaetiibacter sp.]